MPFHPYISKKYFIYCLLKPQILRLNFAKWSIEIFFTTIGIVDCLVHMHDIIKLNFLANGNLKDTRKSIFKTPSLRGDNVKQIEKVN